MTTIPYPISELFAWVIDDPSGRLAIMGFSPGNIPMQAVSSKRTNMEQAKVAAFAKLAAEQTGYPVRLQRFVLAETIQEFKP